MNSTFSRASSLPRAARSSVVVKAENVKIPEQYTKLEPRSDYVFVKVAKQEIKTKRGILLPGAAQRRPTSGDVLAIGDGRTPDGQVDMALKPGETVVYSRFGIGVTDIELGGELHALIREEDCIGVMPKSEAHADDIPEMRPLGDRVLLRVQETSDVTVGGVILPEAAKERPLIGEVVRTGPGKKDKEGKFHAITIKPGDRVVYFKYAGEPMQTSTGEKYMVLRIGDILALA